MDKSKSISPYQVFSIVFVTAVFCAMMYSNYTVNNLDLLMLAVSTIFAIAVLFVLSTPLFIFARRSENENIIRVVQARKPILSSIFSLVYIVYFMYSAVVSLLVFSLLLSNFIIHFRSGFVKSFSVEEGDSGAVLPQIYVSDYNF